MAAVNLKCNFTFFSFTGKFGTEKQAWETTIIGAEAVKIKMEQSQKSGAPSEEEVEELPQEKQKNDPGEYFYILGIKSYILIYCCLFV